MRALLQCGNNLENSRRVFSLASLLAENGVEPIVAVYGHEYCDFFNGLGVRAIPFYKARPALVRPDMESVLGFDPDPQDVFDLDVRRSAMEVPPRPKKLDKNLMGRTFLGLHSIVQNEGIDALVVWNGHTGIVANTWRVYKKQTGMPGGFIERGLLEDGVFFDAEGSNGSASLARGVGELDPTVFAGLLDRHKDAIEHWLPQVRYDNYRAGFQEVREKLILVPLQVQADSNIILHSPRIDTMRRLVLEAIRFRDACFPDYKILVRPHPEEDPKLLLNLPVWPNVAVSSEGNLSDLLRRSEMTVTINSTVGLEAAIYGSIPIVLGEGLYCNEPFVVRYYDADIRDVGLAVRRLRESSELYHDLLMRFLVSYFDGQQVQASYRRLSSPLALLSAFSAEPKARHSVTVAPQIATARSRLKGKPVLTCHVYDLESSNVVLNYRKTANPLDRKTINSMVHSVMGQKIPCQVSAVDIEGGGDHGDVAIVARKSGFPYSDRYALVLDEFFGLHKSAGRAVG